MKKLEKVENINNIYVVIDNHTMLHNSENLLSNLTRVYGETRINLSISLKNYDIPNKLEEAFKQTRNVTENIA